MTINLIPPKLKEERKISKTIGIFYSFSFLYFLLFVLLTGVLFFANIYIKSSITNTEKQIEVETAKANKYKDIETNLKNTTVKINNLKATETDKVMWTKILSEIERSTPVSTQIKSISGDATKKTMAINGFVLNRTDIASLKDIMENSKYFKNVNFFTSSYDDNNKVYTFNLTAELESIK